ncbi:MAG: response regulator [Deltaproteobacteria bacterium]|nr:response regulator [Deltaproteobacteria bacterium]
MLEETKVLVVDDVPDIVDMLAEFLKLNGCHVFKAYNGQEATKVLNREKADIVIADIKLPDTNGISLLERIKLEDPTTPVIMMTGYFEPNILVESMKKGATDFILKPIEFDKLLLVLLRAKREKELLTEKLRIQDSLEDKKKIMLLNRELQNKIKELTAMYQISAKFNTVRVHEDVFEKVLEITKDIFEGRSAAYYIFDGEKEEIFPVRIIGDKGKMERRITFDGNLTKDLRSLKKHIELEDLFLVPLVIRSECIGFLGLEKKKNEKEKSAQEELFLLKLIAEKASTQIENKMLYESLFDSIIQTLNSLIISINRRDAYTQGHCGRVTRNSLKLANLMGLSDYERNALEVISPVHDIGKIGIPDSILLKPGRLTDEEYEIMKNHSLYGEEIISRFEILSNEAKIVRYHHERYDGRGYPDHLSSTDIPLSARIIAVCDAYDAMVTDRPYRKAMTKDEAVAEIIRCRGTQFDPEVADVFVDMIRREGQFKKGENG